MSSFKIKTAVITGAASGLGRALALQLARSGCALVLSDLRQEGIDRVVQESLGAGAAAAHGFVCDVRDAKQVAMLADEAFRVLDSVDLIVNNAGVAGGGPFEKIPLEDWKWVLDTNLWGVIYGCHAFMPRMKEQRCGHILNISSAAGLLSPPRMASYNVAKAGVVALTETLCAELQGTGIGITVACPTFFKTGLLKTARTVDDESRAFAEKMFERSRSNAEHVARVCLRAVERRELYAIPNLDGWLAWNVKRLMPKVFINGMSWASSRIR